MTRVQTAPSRQARVRETILALLGSEWTSTIEMCRKIGTWEGDSAVSTSLFKLHDLGLIERMTAPAVHGKKIKYLYRGRSSGVEHRDSTPGVAGSNPAVRSSHSCRRYA